MSTDSPLDPLRHAHEDSYFHQKNQALIEKMRAKLKAQAVAADLTKATHLDDPELFEQLALLGVTRETLPVLHLVPLLEIAWADGEIQAEERLLLAQAANEAGIEGDARTYFDGLVNIRPSAAFFEGALEFIRVVLAAMPDGQSQAACADLNALTQRIAASSGGIFGLFRTEDTEKVALKRISDRLAGRSASLIKKL